MTITLKVEVPDNGKDHTIQVAVIERPADPTLTDQHCSVYRQVFAVREGRAERVG